MTAYEKYLSKKHSRLLFDQAVLKGDFAYFLSGWIADKRLTVSQLSKQTGFKKNFIRAILDSKASPTLEQVAAFANYFGLQFSLKSQPAIYPPEFTC